MHTDEDPAPRDAEDIYAEFRERAQHGEAVDLERVCDENPRLAPALRALHSLHGSEGLDATTMDEVTFGEVLSELPVREDGAPFEPGAVVGPYTIQEVLGEGGFAFVFRAEQQQPVRRTVALKTLKLGMDTKQVLARFDAERQALALMSHRHIAKVFDAGMTEDGRPYFVMEYVAGVPITNYCDEKRLGTYRRLDLFVSVCEAIAHAHQRAIIHRDLKPSNVLVTTEGERPVPKVIDFGIAKAASQNLTDQTLFTEIGQVIGTPEYMSPEQAAGEGVDTRTDIYALGVLLYELLSGVRPFDSEKLRALGFPAILNFIQEEEPRKLSTRLTTQGEQLAEAAKARGVTTTTLSREMRGDLDWITMKCLAKEPDRRYMTASELADDVGRHLRLEPVSAGPPTWTYRLSKFLRKRRTAVLTTVGIIVTGLVVTVASLEFKERYDADRRAELSDQLVGEGNDLRREAEALRTQIRAQETVYEATKHSIPFWKPVWERAAETREWQTLQDLQNRIEDVYHETFLKYGEARTLVSPDSTPWQQALDALKNLYHEVEAKGQSFVASGLLLQQLTEALGRDKVEQFVAHQRVVRLQTDPPGADVFCFLYEEHEHRRLPVPFSPTQGVVGEPFLRVARLRTPRFLNDPTPAPLEPDDRVLSIDGKHVRTPSDFARAVRDVVDREVTLQILRQEDTVTVQWQPFRSSEYGEQAEQNRLQPGEVTEFGEQFGFTFEGYPLDFVPACRLGDTRKELAVVFPEGSYLLVLRKPGYVDTRLPVATRFPSEIHETVRLVPINDVLSDFVYVPGGSSVLGGNDSSYLQNLPYGEQRVEGFFIGRFEVTFEDYLEFLNARGNKDGKMLPATEEVRQELRILSLLRDKEVTHLELLPLDNGTRTPLAKRQDGVWEPLKAEYRSWPTLGVNYMAAVEYAHWLTATRQSGWRYRLPTDTEWERAARGADGRRYVWGDYLTWAHCWSVRSNFRKRRVAPDTTGFCPTDESPFGVRDLAGSVRELTSGRPSGRGEKDRLFTTRGGGWDSLNEYELRTDSRDGLPSYRRSRNVGFRLVAERINE